MRLDLDSWQAHVLPGSHNQTSHGKHNVSINIRGKRGCVCMIGAICTLPQRTFSISVLYLRTTG